MPAVCRNRSRIVTDDGYETEPAEREVTIRDLFRHTAGLIYGWGDQDIDRVYQRAQQSLWQGGTPPTTA